MGFIGGAIGTFLGVVLQQSFPILLQDFLPFSIELSISISPILTGLLLGVFMSVLFALLPLLSTWYVSPLQVLRIQEKPLTPKKVTIGVLLVIAILVTFSVLAGIARLFMKMIKKYFPSSWSFSARQSLLNLYRPNNQTMTLLLAIGVGSFLISTLYFTKDILLAKASLENSEENPNIILLDVQSNQKEAVINSITPSGLKILDNIPIITMRVANIKGVAANTIRKDSTSTIRRWILNHEFRVTYRDSLLPTEKVVEGVMQNWYWVIP